MDAYTLKLFMRQRRESVDGHKCEACVSGADCLELIRLTRLLISAERCYRQAREADDMLAEHQSRQSLGVACAACPVCETQNTIIRHNYYPRSLDRRKRA